MISILVITHGQTGEQLVDTVTSMLGKLSLATKIIAVQGDDDPDTQIQAAQAAIDQLDSGDGVLLLTDAFGSTPSNIANQAATRAHCRVVTGINLPMLVRVYNYPKLSLEKMVTSAIEAGRKGVMACPAPPEKGKN